jgi:hypothetical protein
MSVSPEIVEARQDPITLTVERGRLRSFAAAIGETRAIYIDVEAARAAGLRDVLVPPTFLMGLELEHSDTFEVLAKYGVDVSNVLHGEQHFVYHGNVCAGDELTFTSRFTDVYSKSNGALDFVVRETRVQLGGTDLVAEMKSVSIVQNRPR